MLQSPAFYAPSTPQSNSKNNSFSQPTPLQKSLFKPTNTNTNTHSTPLRTNTQTKIQQIQTQQLQAIIAQPIFEEDDSDVKTPQLSTQKQQQRQSISTNTTPIPIPVLEQTNNISEEQFFDENNNNNNDLQLSPSQHEFSRSPKPSTSTSTSPVPSTTTKQRMSKIQNEEMQKHMRKLIEHMRSLRNVIKQNEEKLDAMEKEQQESISKILEQRQTNGGQIVSIQQEKEKQLESQNFLLRVQHFLHRNWKKMTLAALIPLPFIVVIPLARRLK